MLAYSFEGLQEGDSHAEASALPFGYREGVMPRIDTNDAFCGKASIFFHNTFASLRLGLENGKRWKTKLSRFICMAYR